MPRRFAIRPWDRDPIWFASRDKFVESLIGEEIDKEKYREYKHLYDNARSRGKVVTVYVPNKVKWRIKYKRIVVPTWEILTYLVDRWFIDASVLDEKKFRIKQR